MECIHIANPKIQLLIVQKSKSRQKTREFERWKATLTRIAIVVELSVSDGTKKHVE